MISDKYECSDGQRSQCRKIENYYGVINDSIMN